MKRSKRKKEQQVIDESAQRIFREFLPEYWTLRDYKPDYGIDYTLEIFEKSNAESYDTLGEHLFIQLKGSRQLRRRKLTVKARKNIEKYALGTGYPKDEAVSVDVVSFPIETPELVTVQRMGAALPVLLKN